MSRRIDADRRPNRREFVKRSISGAALAVSAAGCGGSDEKAPAAPAAAPRAAPAQAKSAYEPVDERFVKERLIENGLYGPEVPANKVTLVVHFFGFAGFVRHGLAGNQTNVVLVETNGLDSEGIHEHRPRLWTRNRWAQTGGTELGTTGIKYWDIPTKRIGILVKDQIQTQGTTRHKKGPDRNQPWEDMDWLPDLADLAGTRNLVDDLPHGAKGIVTTFAALPAGTLITGRPWSDPGQNVVWGYKKLAGPALPNKKPTALTDNLTFFFTIPDDRKVTLRLTPITQKESTPNHVDIELSAADANEQTIVCAITHADPVERRDSNMGDELTHNRAYYRLFKDASASGYPVPVFARGINGESKFRWFLSSSDGHCNCGKC